MRRGSRPAPRPAWEHFADMGPLVWVMTEERLEALCQMTATADEIMFDLETTGLDPWEHASKIVLATFTLSTGDAVPTTYVLPLAHPYSPWSGSWRATVRRVAQHVQKGKYLTRRAVWETRRVVGHNVKFDCRWIYVHTGVNLEQCVTWDTQVGAHLLDENISTRLKVRAADTFSVAEWDDFDLSAPGAAMRVPLQELGEYAALDTWYTYRLAQHQRMVLEIGEVWPDDAMMARLGRVAEHVAMPTVASLTRIEQHGILLDREACLREAVDREQTVAEGLELLARDYQVPGTPSMAPTSRWFLSLCDEAVAQGELTVDATTPTGKPQWNRYVLKRQARKSRAADGRNLAQTILDLREADKQAQFLRTWLAETKTDGRIHASYHPGRVVTGRLSSSDPNMQQVSRVLKHLFVPTDGYYLADCDYSQVELRIAAEISGCVPMLEAFDRGDDLHRMVAALILGKDPSDVTKEERQHGKAVNFGFLYGMGATKFAQYADETYGVLLTPEEAQASYDAFFTLWDGIAEWHARSASYARRYGAVVSPIGRVRRLPEIYDTSMATVLRAEHQAVNSPVQSLASDLMQVGAALVQGLHPARPDVRCPTARVVATVHDSIVAEVPTDDWESVVSDVLSTITSGVVDVVAATMEYRFSVPLEAEGSTGRSWGSDDVGKLVRSSRPLSA